MAGAPGGTPGSRVTSATLLLETEEMGTLNQEVSQLTKELHHMMLLLQLQMTAHHHSPALSSHPHAVQTPHNPASGDHSMENISCLVHPSPHLVPGTHSEGLCQSQSPIFHTHPMDLAEARPGHPQASPPGPWTQGTPSLLGISPVFQCETPALASHPGQGDSECAPLSTSPMAISQSHPSLFLQHTGGGVGGAGGEYSCLLSSAPTSSLLAPLPSSYHPLPNQQHHPLLPPPPEAQPCAAQDMHGECPTLPPPSPYRGRTLASQDSGRLRGTDSHPSVTHPSTSSIPASPPTFPGKPAVGSRGAEEPHGPEPLDDPGGVGHSSMESLLGGGRGSPGSREDSESTSSRRSSGDVQTQSTEQSWSLDLTD
ncbi:hypothetical protein CRUP_003449 [Coryphaenoides rupestris]|nr:hypothetical protein CRUP_003449 [Coryphaenoides rupestris]